jgi:hypothetical protein
MSLSLDDQGPIDKDVVNPLGVAVRVVLEGIAVWREVRCPVADTFQIEHDNVCPRTGPQHPAIQQPEPLGGEGGHLANGLFEGQHWLVPHIALQHARKLAIAARFVGRRLVEQAIGRPDLSVGADHYRRMPKQQADVGLVNVVKDGFHVMAVGHD